jgi:hypothetical protein
LTQHHIKVIDTASYQRSSTQHHIKGHRQSNQGHSHGGQGIGAAEPAGQYEYAGQVSFRSIDVAPTVLWKTPAVTRKHATPPVVFMNLPAGHRVQLVEPETLAKLPTGHAVHARRPEESLYWPTGHNRPTGDVSPTPQLEPAGAKQLPLQPAASVAALVSVPKVV